MRQEALEEADALVEEAQDVSDRLVAEARERADALEAEGRTEAGRLTELAHREADVARRTVERERDQMLADAREEAVKDLAELKVRAERLLSDIELGARTLRSALAGSTIDVLARATGDLSGATERRVAAEVTQPLSATTSTSEWTDPRFDSSGDEVSPDPESDEERPSDERSVAGPEIESVDGPPEGETRAQPVSDADTRRLSDLTVEGRIRFERASGSGFSEAGAAPDDNLEEALAAARPLGWLFRGN